MVNESIIKKVDIKVSGKMRKEKVQAPPSKIVIRKLPPTFTEEDFKDAISPVPENNYFSYVSADKGLGAQGYSRAYINFLNPEEIVSFRDRFDGYVFVDQKGNEFPALVEYAPFQKIPKNNGYKKDIRCGTVDEDPDYVAFLDLLQNPETVNLPQIEALLEEIEIAERALHSGVKVKTPLLEFIEQRNAERFRPGDRKRRKEFDRKKIREEEKRRRKDYVKDYRKRDEYYTTREERDRERAKRKEEEKLKWKEKREEKEKLRKERVERYKADDKFKTKDAAADKQDTDEAGPKDSQNKEEKVKTPPQRTKRYSEVRKKEEKEKRHKEEKSKNNFQSEEKNDDGVKVASDDGISININSLYSNEDEEIKEINEPEEPESMKENVEIQEKGNKEVENNKEYEKEDHEDVLLDEDEEEERIKYDKCDEDEEELGGEDRDDKSSKDPRTERKIRNKDRPAMQLYRPGQARLKTTRLKPNEDGGNDGDSSSSSATSPVMGVNEEKEKEKEREREKEKEKEKEVKEKEKLEPDYKAQRSYAVRGAYDKKYSKYRESRGHNYYWDDRETGHSKYKDDFEPSTRGGGRGGARRGYSYHQERENKGKYVGRSRDNESSQFKSMTFRRSTSQE